MPYQRASDNRQARTRMVDLIAAAQDLTEDVAGPAAGQTQVVTAAGNTPALELGDVGTLRLALTASAVGGTTPSVTVNVQTSFDGGVSDPWTTIGSFPATTANGTQRLRVGTCDRFVRAQWGAPTGTSPTFTLSLTGEGISGGG